MNSEPKKSISVPEYGRVELVARNQPYDLAERFRDYLNKNTPSEDGIHLLESGTVSGLLRVEEEPLTGQDGLKVDITIGIKAKTTSLDSLVRTIKTNFPQFKVKKDSERPIVTL